MPCLRGIKEKIFSNLSKKTVVPIVEMKFCRIFAPR